MFVQQTIYYVSREVSEDTDTIIDLYARQKHLVHSRPKQIINILIGLLLMIDLT